MSNIDHGLPNWGAYSCLIIVPQSAIIGDRECCTLPPNAGKCHATSYFFLRPITEIHRAPALFALHDAHDACEHQPKSYGL